MTEEEEREIYYTETRPHELKHLIGEPEVWRRLLSLHFDLFGWIPEGLAIDKTKIQ